MIVKIIYEPVYRFDLIFIAGCTIEQANKVLLKKYQMEPLPKYTNCSGITFSASETDYPKSVKGISYGIWIGDEKDFYCLLHEVCHLVVRVLEEKGMSISENLTEPFAYYMEFWFRTLWRVMSSKKKKRGDKKV